MTTNIPLEKTLIRIAKANEDIAKGVGKTSEAVDLAAQASIDGTNTTSTFWLWWASQAGSPLTKYELLCRWFSILAAAWQHKTYGLKWYDADISGSSDMTPTGDLAGKTAAQLCTKDTVAVADWADEDPMTWYIRGNALSLTDGTMNIIALEGESGFDISGESAPVYTFSLAKYKRQHNDGEFNYKEFRTAPAEGFTPMAGDIAPNGTVRPMTWLPTFGGGLTRSGKLSSGAGLPPALWLSASGGNTKAKLWNNFEGLWTDCATIYLLDMWQLRHFNLENSGICEGCTSYSLDYTAAASETGVKRVILTPGQAGNFIVGSTVSVGSSARSSSNVLAQIASIDDVTIEGTTYKEVNLDVDEEFDTVAGTTHISTMPWHSGATEMLPEKKDGCPHSLTDGRSPARIMGVEILDGAYVLQLDPLMNVTQVDADGAVYELYVARDSTILSSAVTNYTKVGSATVPIMNNNPSSGEWIYIKELLTNKEVMFPDMFGGSSTTYLKSAFARTGSAGVRAPWRFGYLNVGGAAGLACLGGNGPSGSDWGSRPRLGDSGKKRGELA